MPIDQYSAAASGWAFWALAHPEFGSSVNPITTRGADYAHHITASPPGFENPAAALLYTIKIKYWNASGSGFPPSLIPALQNIGILHHKKAKLPKHLQHSVCDLFNS